MSNDVDAMHFRDAVCWYEEVFKRIQLWNDMVNTVEASPWHREDNVGVHTHMVVTEYIRMCTEANDFGRSSVLGLFSCMFHDTGKPAAKIEKYREDRGSYFAFHGHEVISSRLFETFACEHPTMFEPMEIFKICWMIEHHMPWSIEESEKRRRLALTAQFIGVDVYTRALLADQYGRIADDKEAKDARANVWIEEFYKLTEMVEPIIDQGDNAPILFVPIAAAGSGKTTLIDTIKQSFYDDMNVFSLDELRHIFYNNERTHEGYRDAYDQCINDKTFESRADSVFTGMVRERKHLVVDNTNLGAKRRGKYITQARRLGYKVVGVTMPVSLQTILDRQHIRLDKNVPDEAVIRQYNTLQQPSFGEFDDIVVASHNLDLVK